MIVPPVFLRLRLRNGEHGWPTLWLPVFLLWPLLLVMFVVLVAFAVSYLPLSGEYSASSAIRACFALYRALCATRGTHVDVVGHHAQALITVY